MIYCEKECKFDAIHVENNLAVIDYEKCKDCGKCVVVCPQDALVNFRPLRKKLKKQEKSEKKKVKTEDKAASTAA